MEKRISTFTPEEKESMGKLEEFQAQLESQLNENEEIIALEYYDKLNMGKDVQINSDFYIATIKTSEGLRTGIYAIGTDNLVGYVDEAGNIEFVDDFLNHVSLALTIDDLKELNLNNLKIKSEELDPQEFEDYLENKISNGTESELDEEKKEDKTEEEKENEQVEQALQEEMGEDLHITFYREIKDNQMEKQFPGKFSGSTEIGMAYSSSLNKFICVKKEGEQFKRVDGIEPSKPTLKTVISINEDGSKIERKCPHALLKTSDDRKELSITIGQYGYVETGIVDRLPCNERVEHQVREAGQDESGRTSKEIRTELNRGGKEVPHEMAHLFEENEQIGIEKQNLEAIDGDSDIELKDGTITTLKQEANKAKVSVDEFIRILQETEGTTWDEKIENTHSEIERQTGAPERFKR